jgi:hypothetical protein
MPLDSGSRVGTSVNKSPQPSDSQSSPVQDVSDSSARHKSRFIRILQDVGSYLANKFHDIKNFFYQDSKTRDISKTGSSKYCSPDTGKAFPSYKSNSNKKKVETAPLQESKSIEIIQEIREKPKKAAQPSDTQNNSEESLGLNLPPIDTSDNTDSKGETVADRQQQGVTPPIMPDSHPSAHQKTKYVYVEAQKDKEKVGMDAFEEKMNKRGFNKDEYDSKRPWPSEVKVEPVKVEKKSLFSMFLSLFGIGNTSTKTSSVQATQSTNQHQSPVVNSIKEAQEGIMSGLPSYNKASKDIEKQERVLAQWIPYIFPRYQDDDTKIAGREYGFTSIADVTKFSKDATLFTRLIKCSLNITRDTTNNGESKAIYNILDTKNCKYFRDSMQTFLNFVQSKDCKNKMALDGITDIVAKKDCIKFFTDAIKIIDERIK